MKEPQLGVSEGPLTDTPSGKPPLGLTPRKLVEEAWEQERQDREQHLKLSQQHARRLDILAALTRWACSPNRQHHDLLPVWIKEFSDLDGKLEDHILLPHPNAQGQDVGWTWWMPKDEAVKRIFESLHSDTEKLKPVDYEREIESLRNECKQLRQDRDEYGLRGEERLEDLKVARRNLGVLEDKLKRELKYIEELHVRNRSTEVKLEQLQRDYATVLRQRDEAGLQIERLEAEVDGMEPESGKPSTPGPLPVPKGYVRLGVGEVILEGDLYIEISESGEEKWSPEKSFIGEVVHENEGNDYCRPVKELSREPDRASSLPPLPKGWVRLSSKCEVRTADKYWVEGEGWKWFDNECINQDWHKSEHFCRKLPA